MPDEMEEIIQDFIIETQEILDGLDEKFVDLEKNGADQSLLNEIFRNVHTIKGASGFLGFNQMVELTHATENVLKKLKESIIELTPPIMDVLLESMDLMKVLLGHIKDKDGGEEDLSSIISRLKEIEEGGAPPPEEETGEPVREEPAAAEEVEEKPQAPPGPAQGSAKEQPREKIQLEQTIRVDVERLDNVLNLVGELVLGRNRLTKITSNLEARYVDDPEVSSLSETMAFLSLITTDLQIAVMKTRMQQVKKVFNKFPRMVRDLARSRGKEVELIISGEETEVDKSVIENIADPLVHLIRNSIDHGLEPLDERRRIGKPEKGVLKLSAAQEGNNIVIEIEDDGRGIDPELIKAKAVERGLIHQTQADGLSEREALELIFTPGFSTAKQVSDVSGRGVGMDVVRTNIQKLNGTIDIITERGVGTRFSIKLPLTLAIIQTLMVQVGGDTYAIPLGSVLETLRVTGEEIRTVDSQEVIRLRGEVLPIIRLSRLFGTSSGNGSGKLYVVVVTASEKKFGIAVDRLKGQEEVVIKAVEGNVVNLNNSNIIAGATITGDGRVVLIVDVSMMLESLTSGALAYA